MTKEMTNKLNCSNQADTNIWNKETIYDACKKYCEEHNISYLRRKDFRADGMPAIQTVEKYFNMDIVQFIKQYFPQSELYKRYGIYTDIPKEELFKLFVNEMERLNLPSQKHYDQMRDKKLPTAKILMRIFNVLTWTELKSLAQVHIQKQSTVFNVESRSSIHCTTYKVTIEND